MAEIFPDAVMAAAYIFSVAVFIIVLNSKSASLRISNARIKLLEEIRGKDFYSIIFLYDEDEEPAVRGTLYGWGDMDYVSSLTPRCLQRDDSNNTKVHIVEKIPAEDLIKMISTSGCVGRWWDAHKP